MAFLEYMIDLHFGEEAVKKGIEKGLFDPDEEYFPGIEFPGTTKLHKEIHNHGVYAPGDMLRFLNEEERETQLWYRVQDESLNCPTPPEQGPCKATVQLKILKGWKQPQEILSIKRTAILTDCSPNLDILGVHGWHIALEFAEFLCFQELMGKVDNLLHS